ncbi:MAG: RIP metalloprotease RseP [Candidatus Doudnabacteria bacterium]|nr:RIP metalloprotease RseP [Candidatus Doudnabacteria bacterium]
MLTFLIFVVVLGLLVFVHELGHFIMAKRAGMKVEEFGFGFPPRLFGVKYKETIYSLNWIPLGGFVKIFGENGETDEAGSFRSKSFLQRFAVLIAGVTMNMALAWFLLSIVFGIGVPTVLETEDDAARAEDVKVQVVDVATSSPAEEAGLQIGDEIRAVQGEAVESVEQAVSLVDARRGEETELTLAFGDEERTATVVPRAETPEGEGALGIGLVRTGTLSYPWYEAIGRGFVSAFALLGTIVIAFGTIIVEIFSGAGVSADLAGPVGIAVLTGQAAKLGIASLLQFTAVLSVNLALINVLPLPALDGGRILFAIIEKLRGKPVSQKTEGMVHTVGFVSLLVLMLAVTVRDVARFWDPIANFFQNLF